MLQVNKGPHLTRCTCGPLQLNFEQASRMTLCHAFLFQRNMKHGCLPFENSLFFFIFAEVELS